MRLIDADKLKAHYSWWNCGNENSRSNKRIFDDIIDLQPTVESRPNGKWIDCSEEGYVECPFCHSATTCEDNIEELHFCWNCGAELRADTGGEE